MGMSPDQFITEVSKRNDIHKQYALLDYQKKILCKFFDKEIPPGLTRSIFKDEGIVDKLEEVRYRSDSYIDSLDITKTIVDVTKLLQQGASHSFIKSYLKSSFDIIVFKMKGLKEWVIHNSATSNNNYSPMIVFEGDGFRIVLEPLTVFITNKRSL